MPAQAGITVENNFKNGLVTEATGLNFPENACVETFDCVFNIDGSVERRLGFDFENNFEIKNIDPTGGVINNYLWRDVSGDGTLYLVVSQVGDHLYFYDASSTDPISAHKIASNINLVTYSPTGAPSPKTEECQFSAGNGLLFVNHPYLEPFYISYDANTQVVTGTQITIQIRDLAGIEDTTDITTRPIASLAGTSTTHYYNLLNQGWDQRTNTTVLDPLTNLKAWDAARTDVPSDCDVMWRFKNSSDAFATAVIANVISGSSPAPKGAYILNAFNQDRQTASVGSGAGLTILPVTTSYFRPTTNAFFAGRVFYAGTGYVGYNSNIYFSQVVERPSQYGHCYQLNDPTAEDLFDLLPSDGGVIVIREAGTIIKLLPISGGLAVFASNGIWLISGSTGLGFTATDYSISKISSIRTLTHTSFVDIQGAICFWNLEGIYIMSPGGPSGAPEIKSMTHDKLLSYFYDIPPSSKRAARGYFNSVTGIVQWLFRSEEAGTIEEIYQYDSILNFSTFTGGFYPWTISEGDVKLSGLIVIENLGGAVSTDTIVDDAAEDIIDDAGDSVIVFTINDGIIVPKFKYFTYYADDIFGGKFTFSEEQNTDYIDWYSYDTAGIDYTSLFTTGYKIRGNAINKFVPTYLKLYSRHDEDTSYYIKGLWDYATSGDTGRWSPRQLISNSNSNYSYNSRRIKMPGHGYALQFNVESVSGEPFNIIGWAEMSTGNSAP